MKRPLHIFLLAVLLLTFPFFCSTCSEKPSSPSVLVHFSPHGGCTDAVIREVNSARSSIFVQAYSFTSAPIAKSLLNAQKRGVRVAIILDKSQVSQRYSSLKFFLNQGIPAKIDSAHAIAHNKVMIIDGETVITGSFNFTKAAEENNAENLLVIHDKKLADLYARNWQDHDSHSNGYRGIEK